MKEVYEMLKRMPFKFHIDDTDIVNPAFYCRSDIL